MSRGLVARIGAGLGAALLMACAVAIGFVAAAFALYAVLRLGLPAAGAAALTAVAFGAVAVLLGLMTPRIVKGAQGPAKVKPSLKETARTAARVATTVMGLLAELALDERRGRDGKPPKGGPRRR